MWATAAEVTREPSAPARDAKDQKRGVMRDGEEPGSDKVTATTSAFEEIDAQVFPGPGRGATRSEAAASARWGGPSPRTVEAYRRMSDVVVQHQRAHNAHRASSINVRSNGKRGVGPNV